ncbi:MAG: twin-arginine translocase TatA/TatE family subunit [Acidobacteriota bacterium]|nr:twin-arginine translocase TatA/TatE family subunit [Acidobacteriota bacterium]
MFGLGFPEVAFIIVLALLIFGPKRLPELGRTLGKGLGEFRRASNDLKRTFNAELSLDDDEERPALSRRSLREGDSPAEPRVRNAPDENLPDLREPREPREGRVARGSVTPADSSRTDGEGSSSPDRAPDADES